MFYIFTILFSFQLPPDEPIGETAVVDLLFYPNMKCFKLYTYNSLTLVVIEHCASNVRLSLLDISYYIEMQYSLIC